MFKNKPQTWKNCNIMGKQWSLMKNPGLGCEVRKEKNYWNLGDPGTEKMGILDPGGSSRKENRRRGWQISPA